MEEVAIMIPPPPLVNNDELSDETESINLDLHVSDTEDSTESSKKSDEAEINEQTESEEDILNKYVDDAFKGNEVASKDLGAEKKLVNGILEKEKETHKKCNGILSPPSIKEIKLEQQDELMDTLVEEKDDTLTEDQSKEKDENDDTIAAEPSSEDKSKVSNEEKERSKEETSSSEDKVLSDAPKEQCEKTKSTEVDSDRTDSDKKVSDDKMDVDESKVEEPCEKTKESCTIDSKSDDQCGVVSSSTEEANSSSNNSNNENKSSETKTDSDNNEDDDLLCVMDEKSLEEANENKDENSCSASEKDDEAKESEENNDDENNEETNEDSNFESNDGTKEIEEGEEMMESQTELDMDSSECAMDIEESDIGGVVFMDVGRSDENEISSDERNKIDGDKDANKENEEHGGVAAATEKPIKENGIAEHAETNGIAEKTKEEEAVFEGFDDAEKDTSKKSTKRPLSDSSIEEESTKKIRLETENLESEPEKPKRPIKLLDKFRKFMLDKKLKTLTRFELEELCIQKMCECIVNKSEIGELRQKIMIQEQTIDNWRKDAAVVAKQTRDLKIVHERLMADLKSMREQTGKPLVPVKITRSVGLQAIIENPLKLRPVPIINGPGPVTQPPRANIVTQPPNKAAPAPQNRQQPIKPKTPQRVNSVNNRPLQPIAQKDNVNTPKPRQSLPSPAKKGADPKAVIDLTDEDEKNQTSKQTTTNTASPTVRVINKPNNANTTPKSTAPSTPNTQASKIMFVSPAVLPRNSTVMVKMNSNGLVTSANGLTTIPNGQVSVVSTPVVRTVSQVRVPITSATTVRTASPAKQPIYKHPAPLPAAPNYSLVGKKPIPPKPHLNLTRSNCGTGIVLQWKMPYKLDSYETIVSYQLYAYQETKSPPKTDNWGKIGDVKALELPMAVTLTQFAVGNRYFFAVRAVDGQKRLGPFSEPENILL